MDETDEGWLNHFIVITLTRTSIKANNSFKRVKDQINNSNLKKTRLELIWPMGQEPSIYVLQ